MKKSNIFKFTKLFAFALVLSSLVIGNISVNAAEAAVVTREFNAKYDEMLDDFSASTPIGTPSVVADYHSFPYLRVPINEIGHEDDYAIYKYASGTYLFHQLQIGLSIRLVEGTLPLSNLVLALRGDDTWKTYRLTFDTLLDGNADPLPELTNEYQDLIIDIPGSIDDDSVVYVDKSGNPTTTRVTDKVLGFHIFNNEATTAVVEVKRVFVIQSGIETSLDVFERENVYLNDENCWWRGSVGAIEPRHVVIQNNSSYEVKNSEKGDGYENIVLRLKDLNANAGADLTVAPIYKDGTTGTTKTYVELKDLNDNSLPALTESYQNVVINYAKSGWNADVIGVKVSTPSKVALNRVFFTNLEEDEVATNYPVVDFSDITVFDHFNRTQSGFNGDYEASISDPIVVNNGLYYTLSYSNGNMVSIDGNYLVYDATTLPDTEWINFKEASTRGYNGEKYLVMKVKATDGASLERFEVGGVAGSNWYSASGLKVPALDVMDYPYTDGEWKYIIVDIALTGMTFAENNTLDTIYRGTGKLFIDTIFFANDYKVTPNTEVKSVLSADEKVVNYLDGGYQYLYGGGANQNAYRYLAIEMKGEAGTTLDAFRIEFELKDSPNDVKWFKDGALKGIESAVLTDEYQVFYIDLVESGLDVFELAHLHFHFGAFDGHTGKVTVKEVAYVSANTYKTTVFTTETTIDYLDGGYKYQYGGGANTKGYRYLYLTMKGNEGTTFDAFRIEFEKNDASKVTKWAKDGVLKGIANEALATDYQTYVVDLIASGLDVNDIAHLHLHFGAFEEHSGVVTIKEIGYFDDEPSAVDIMEDYHDPDIVKPVISYDPANTATEGDTIKVEPTVTDNISASDKITAVIEVIKGSGDDAIIVNLDSNNSFVAEVGVYTIKITATDEAGNESTLTKQITVTETSVEDTTKPTVDLTLPSNVKVGDTVTLTPTVTDDVSASDKITVVIEVELGDETVELNSNKAFVAKAGTYNIKVTATDEAGNEQVLTKTLVVKASGSFNNWLLGGIIAVIILIAGAGIYIFFRKK